MEKKKISVDELRDKTVEIKKIRSKMEQKELEIAQIKEEFNEHDIFGHLELMRWFGEDINSIYGLSGCSYDNYERACAYYKKFDWVWEYMPDKKTLQNDDCGEEKRKLGKKIKGDARWKREFDQQKDGIALDLAVVCINLEMLDFRDLYAHHVEYNKLCESLSENSDNLYDSFLEVFGYVENSVGNVLKPYGKAAKKKAEDVAFKGLKSLVKVADRLNERRGGKKN